ncbi:MAG: PRC-barrel domain-containing protein [Alphaproteobacteria bacterium]|nr:PRC-barrel domain-containing protein [Alphaproteobacteria bacterium]
MRNLLIATSAFALTIAGAEAAATDREGNLPAQDKTAVERTADDAARAIEKGAEATGEALERAGDAVADTAKAWTNGLDDFKIGSTKYTTPARDSYTGRDILGAEIYGSDGQVVARVDDVWLSDRGTVEALLVDRGGFLGLGGEDVALRRGQVTFAMDPSRNVFGTIGLTDEQLKAIADTRYDATVEFDPKPKPDEHTTLEHDVLGRAVVGSAGERIGSVRDVLLSRDGRLTHLVITRGGLLGFGGDLVAVPVSSLSFGEGAGEGDLVLPLTEAQLKNEPEFVYYSPPSSRQ